VSAVSHHSGRSGERHAASLADLFEGIAGLDEAWVSGVTLDSRQVRPGDLYVALPGRAHHGAEFAAAAVAAGAVAVLTDQAGGVLTAGLDGPVVVTHDPRQAMAGIAAQVYDYPSRSLTMFAITGTNGKTTTSYLMAAALRAAGRHAGLIGTIGFALDGEPIDLPRTTVTTPEAPELQRLLAVMRDEGADSVVMEVSSHALALGRADAILFDVAAFTNFGRDHLDFHGDEHSYFEAKASLFTAAHTARAVINIDDPRGPELLDRCRRAGVPAVTVSLADPSADYSVESTGAEPAIAEPAGAGSAGDAATVARLPGRTLSFSLRLPGEFNVRNALTAIAMLDLAGVDLDLAALGLSAAQVPGRMQLVELGPGAPTVYVDFAHTPQAISAALRAVSPRRCIVVLGAGGDRDPEKRRPMGAAAARGAAVVLVTDDNPRTEVPEAIRAEVIAGAQAEQEGEGLDTEVIDAGDRRSAIRRALDLAGADDVVAILGKGHEIGQEVAGQVLAFSDIDVVRDEWQRRGRGPT
jgi:UDP-N-acetylmuramoyl-L-alanyl-D-glutamate--2,6-diaminopimelate ligase